MKRTNFCNCSPSQVCPICAENEKAEREIENEIFQYFSRVPGCLIYKTGMTGMSKGGRHVKSNPMEIKGRSDLVMCYHGRYIAIEVKKKGGKQRPDQIEFEQRVKACGGIYWLVFSLEQTIEKFKKVMI